MKYIGGEFEINPFELSRLDGNDSFLNKYILYSSGRTALKYILKTIQPDKPILLPAYLCESLILPLKDLGLKYEFFKINNDLTIDFDYLENKIEEKDFSAIIYINYFGFIKDALKFKEIKKIRKDIIIIEDWSHLSIIPYELNLYKGIGDIIFGSFRKVFPVPDGGFILKNRKFNYKVPKSNDHSFPYVKTIGKVLRYFYLNKKIKDSELENTYLELLELAEKNLDKVIPEKRISPISYLILKGIKKNINYKKRRENYKTLLNLFIKDNLINNYIDIICNKLEKYDVPYMMPVFISNNKRNYIREELKKKGIFSSIIWDIPNEIGFKESKNISNNILCLPIDQRYNTNEMNEIYIRIREIIKNDRF